MKLRQRSGFLLLALLVIKLPAIASEDDGHEAHDEEAQSVNLSNPQVELARITVKPLMPSLFDYAVYAPGEIKANGYTSYLVSPRVESVVLMRHATLGEHVTVGQPLVTLFSEDVAEAQAAFVANRAEWQRVQSLGRKTVGDKRHINASTAYKASRARLMAFGVDEDALGALLGKDNLPLGEYTLTAKIDGAVLSDAFNQGQRVGAGGALMELANESQLWVEARLPANSQLQLPKGSVARITVAGDDFEATVAQEAHTIDPQTRTRVVRLLVDNSAHALHPGMFADVYFQFKTEEPVLAVSEGALMRDSDGDWMVYVEEHPGEFKPVEVELGRSLGDVREIRGIAPGARVVVEGAFFVASQLGKGGFDPHDH